MKVSLNLEITAFMKTFEFPCAWRHTNICEQFYVLLRTQPRNSEEPIEHKLHRRLELVLSSAESASQCLSRTGLHIHHSIFVCAFLVHAVRDTHEDHAMRQQEHPCRLGFHLVFVVGRVEKPTLQSCPPDSISLSHA